MPIHSWINDAERPLSYQTIWQLGEQKGLAAKLRTAGQTPWDTLGAQLYVDVRDNELSRFIKVGKRPTPQLKPSVRHYLNGILYRHKESFGATSVLVCVT